MRQIEVLISQGHSVAGGCREAGISEPELLPLAQGVRGGMGVTQVKQLKTLKRENQQLKRLVADLARDKAMLEEVSRGKLLSPKRRRQGVTKLQSAFRVSERRACRVAQQPRCTQRYIPNARADEAALTKAIVALAKAYSRYGHRRVTALLKDQG